MNLVGHQKNLTYLSNISTSEKLSHAYLFVGPKHTGKTLFGRYFAKKLLCTGADRLCDQCPSCRLFNAGNHPDFLSDDGSEAIGIDQMRELIHFLELKPYQSKLKIALITHFERLSVAAANSFLKTLEEPAQNTILILTAENQRNLLPTIVSRSQLLKFSRVSKKETQAYLQNTLKVSKDISEKALKVAGGRIGLALELSFDPEKLKKSETFLTEFEEVTWQNNLCQKLLYAENLAKDRDDFFQKLDFLEIYLADRLRDREALKITAILDKIAKSKESLYRNGNSRLIAESLVLWSPNG